MRAHILTAFVLVALVAAPIASAEPTTLQRIVSICEASVAGCTNLADPVVPAPEPAPVAPEAAPETPAPETPAEAATTTTPAQPAPENAEAVTTAAAPSIEPEAAPAQAAPQQAAQNDASPPPASDDGLAPASAPARNAYVALAGPILAIISVLIVIAVFALPWFHARDRHEPYRDAIPRETATAMQLDLDRAWHKARAG